MTNQLRFFPEIEFLWLKRTNLFPVLPDLKKMQALCLGTKSRQLGDALVLTPLPRILKKHYPHLKIMTYPRAMNPVVMDQNPYIDGICYLPSALYGDDIDVGSGHVIELKHQGLNLPVPEQVKPELYLSDSEKKEGQAFVKKTAGQRALVAVHLWGHTSGKDFLFPLESFQVLEKIFSKFKNRICFVQIGVQGEPVFPFLEKRVFFSKKRWDARKLFAMFSYAQGFIGVDSGPMHVAKAFKIPSLIFVTHFMEGVFQKRKVVPYYLIYQKMVHFLYEDNTYVSLPALDQHQSLNAHSELKKIERFLNQF